MKEKELYIFDLDGTLIDSKEDIADSVNLTLTALGMKPVSKKKIYSYIGVGVTGLLKDILGEEREQNTEEVLKLFSSVYMKNLLNTTGYYENLFSLVTTLKKKGKKLAVCTNKSIGYTEKIAEGLKMHDLFDIILGGDSVPKMKPAPDMLLEAMRHTSVSPEQSVMIGDGVNDILSAQAAGIPVIAVGYGLGEKQYLTYYHPEFYCETTQELISVLL